jgi:hypothetical protein
MSAQSATEHPGRANSKAFEIAASVALTALVCFLVTSSYVYYHFLVGSFFAYGLAAILIVQIRARVPVLDFVGVAALAAAFFCCNGFVLHYVVTVRAIYSFVGLASLLLLGLRTIWTRTDRELLIYCFVPALLLTAGMGFDGFFLEHSAGLHSKTLDLYLYSADCSFGIQSSFLVGQLFYNSSWLLHLSVTIYEACMVPLVLVYAVMLSDRRRALNAFVAFLIAGPLGVIFFLIVPGAGPIYAFGHFPAVPLPTADVARLALEPILVNAPRNAIPSLHLTWALLAFWNTRRGPAWLRILALFLLADTALATLGTGQHYLVDLIAAVPFALMVQALASNVFRVDRAAWIVPSAAGLSLTLLWLGIIRYGVNFLWSSPSIPWLLTIVTLGSTGFLYIRLRHAEDHSPASDRVTLPR